MAKVTSKLQVTLPKALDTAQRLRLLEQSILRQRERERKRPELTERREGEDRGWTREELYERGRPR